MIDVWMNGNESLFSVHIEDIIKATIMIENNAFDVSENISSTYGYYLMTPSLNSDLPLILSNNYSNKQVTVEILSSLGFV